MSSFKSLILNWAKMIKIEHTLFSLPFVVVAALLAIDYEQRLNPTFKPELTVFIWIFLCLVGARSSGMTLNRIIDANIDALNPRTKDREIPAGKISKKSSWIFSIFGVVILTASAFQLPRICQLLLPIPIIWIWVYPYLKRLTWLCHLFLGTTLGGAALGAWLAISGSFNHIAPLYLFFAVSFWVAAFDIVYAIADIDFDRSIKLNSIPAKFGKEQALRIVKVFHFLSVLLLYLVGESLSLNLIYKLGVFIFLIGLLYEQHLAKKEKLEAAFFTVNSWLGIIFMIFVFWDCCRTPISATVPFTN